MVLTTGDETSDDTPVGVDVPHESIGMRASRRNRERKRRLLRQIAFGTALVVFSDGEPSDTAFTIDDLLDTAAASGPTIHTVALCPASKTSAFLRTSF